MSTPNIIEKARKALMDEVFASKIYAKLSKSYKDKKKLRKNY